MIGLPKARSVARHAIEAIDSSFDEAIPNKRAATILEVVQIKPAITMNHITVIIVT